MEKQKKIGRPRKLKSPQMIGFLGELEEINKFKRICQEACLPHNKVLRDLVKVYNDAYEDQSREFIYDASKGKLIFDD